MFVYKYLVDPLLSVFPVFGYIPRCREHFITRKTIKGTKIKLQTSRSPSLAPQIEFRTLNVKK